MQTESKKVINRASWIHVHDGRVLFIKSPKRNVYFDPGVKVSIAPMHESAEGKRVRHGTTLCAKMQRDLNITLKLDSLEFLTSYKAPAHGDEEPGTMVQQHCYLAQYKGLLIPERPTKHIDHIVFIDSGHVCVKNKKLIKVKLSPAGEYIIGRLKEEGFML